MTPVLRTVCMLATLAGVLARPQDIAGFREQPLPSTPNQDEVEQPQEPNYSPDDIEKVASLKRNYQAAFAALASQMASQTQIFADVYQESSNTPSRQSSQTNNNLYHRNIIPIAPRRGIRHKKVHSNRRSAIFSPVNLVASINDLQIQSPQPRETYIYNSVEAQQPAPEQRRQEPLVILPNGFLADTPEVEAARREHLATVERALAAVARAQRRRPSHAAEYRPAQAAEYRPAQAAEYRPAQAAEYRPAQAAEFRPAQAAEYRPAQAAEYRPAQAAEYRPAQAAEYRPAQAAEFRPAKAAEYRPAQAAEYRPAQAAEYRPEQQSPAGPAAAVRQAYYYY